MKTAPAALADTPGTMPHLPPWISRTQAETPEDTAFLSGAALCQLHLVTARADVPHALLRDRLALRAAAACTRSAGRPEDEALLRDALCLLRPGDQPGPAGEIAAQWRRAAERPPAVSALHRALPAHTPDQIAAWLRLRARGGPVGRAAFVVATVLAEAPRAQTTALIMGDAALAQALGWDHLMPLLAGGLKPADLRRTGQDLATACHRAIAASAVVAVQTAADLARRAARLQGVRPRLRARGAGEALALLLRRDAVLPAALPLPDRAARRLCDRLVDLGVIRELTGRDTFRLYGL